MKIRRQRILDLYMIFWGTVFVAYLGFMVLYIVKGLIDPSYCLVSGGQVGSVKLIRIHK